MERRRNDPEYQIHERKRPTREREGPRTDATGQEDAEERGENSSQAVNVRQNMGMPAPSQVRETQRKHGSPDALPEDDQ